MQKKEALQATAQRHAEADGQKKVKFAVAELEESFQCMTENDGCGIDEMLEEINFPVEEFNALDKQDQIDLIYDHGQCEEDLESLEREVGSIELEDLSPEDITYFGAEDSDLDGTSDSEGN
jgi:hypothetical protein